MTFKPGVITNPKGCPDVVKNTKGKQTGPKTEAGKIRSMISSGVLKYAKRLKFKRHCEKCPLKPVINNGQEIINCAHYRQNAECKLSINDWRIGLEAYMMAEKLGEAEMMKVVSATAYLNSLKASAMEEMQQGHPNMWANEFLNTSISALEKVGKLKLEQEKIKAGINGPPQTVNMFDASALIKAYQEENVPHNKNPQPEDTTKNLRDNHEVLDED